MVTKELKIIIFSIILSLLIIPTFFNYGMWIGNFYVPYINEYVSDISDELIKMLFIYVIIFYLKTPEIRNYMKIIYYYHCINCFVVFSDYIYSIEVFNNTVVINYDLLDHFWIVVKSIIFISGLIYLFKRLIIRYELLKLNSFN